MAKKLGVPSFLQKIHGQFSYKFDHKYIIQIIFALTINNCVNYNGFMTISVYYTPREQQVSPKYVSTQERTR